MRFPTVALILAGSLYLTACASTPPPYPDDAMSKADYAIGQATQKLGEDNQSLLLYHAEQKMARARALLSADNITEEQVNEARRLAEEATADARYAKAKAGADAAQKRLSEVKHQLDDLQQQLESGRAQ